LRPALVVNENFPAPSTQVLRSAGFDVFAIAEAHPGMDDREVMELARTQGRWLLSRDALRKRPLLTAVPTPGSEG
jgi:Domain of unknown function (DUF5615)